MPLLGLLGASGIPWLAHNPPCVSPSSFPCLHLPLCSNLSFLKGHQSYRMRAHPHDLLLTCSSAKSLFPIKSHSQGTSLVVQWLRIRLARQGMWV